MVSQPDDVVRIVEEDSAELDDKYVYGDVSKILKRDDPSAKYEAGRKRLRRNTILIGLLVFLVALAAYLLIWGRTSVEKSVGEKCAGLFGENNYVVKCTSSTFSKQCTCGPKDCGIKDLPITQTECLRLMNANAASVLVPVPAGSVVISNG